MALEFSDLPVICASVLISGFVHGSVGFGSGLIAVGLLGRFIGIREASVLLNGPVLILSCVMWWRLREHASLKRAVPLTLAALVGIHIGMQFLLSAQKHVLDVIGGALMLGTAVYSAVPQWSLKPWHPVWLGVPCGLLSGMMGGVYSSGGPPVVAFMSTQGYDRLQFVASLQAVFVLTSLFRTTEIWVRGAMTTPMLMYSACAGVVMIGGSLLGVAFLKRIPDRVMRRLVVAGLLVLGILYLFR